MWLFIASVWISKSSTFCHSSCSKEWHKPYHRQSTEDELQQMMDRFCNAAKKGTAWSLWRKCAGAECSEANTTEAETNNLKLQLDRLHWEVFLHWTLSPAALLPPQGCVCWCRRGVTSPWRNQSTSNLHIYPQISFFMFLWGLHIWLGLILTFAEGNLWALAQLGLTPLSLVPQKCELKGIVHPKNIFFFIIYYSKPVLISFFFLSQKKILKNVGDQTVAGSQLLP